VKIGRYLLQAYFLAYRVCLLLELTAYAMKKRRR